MWQEQAKTCPLCAGELKEADVHGRTRRRCVECGFVLYLNPASATAAVVVNDAGEVLLIRRAIEPYRDHWALPAGYQEIDEDPTESLVREVREETGVEVEVLGLLDILHVPDDPRRPANVAVFLARAVAGEPRPGAEEQEVGWFALDALPEPIGFDNYERILVRLQDPQGYPDSPWQHLRELLAGRSASAEAPLGNKDQLTYRDAGVDIAAQDEALEQSKEAIRETFTAGVLGDVGLFGGLFDPARLGWKDFILVASSDGVGTKLEVARMVGEVESVGRDLVHHLIDDILVQGALPFFFLDYIAMGVLEPEVVSGLVRGCASACKENGLALLGGETAEMPGLYAPGHFDVAGFIVGAVRRETLLDGSRVQPGQRLIGLPSSGLHTNGYSLARMICFERLGLAVEDRPAELEGASIGEALLAVHRSYLNPLRGLVENGRIAAMAHITGGGLRDNLRRVLGPCDAFVNRAAWPRPGLFRLLVEGGRLDEEEAFHAFNMGIGMVLVVDEDSLPAVHSHLEAQGETAFEIGELRAGSGTVRWSS